MRGLTNALRSELYLARRSFATRALVLLVPASAAARIALGRLSELGRETHGALAAAASPAGPGNAFGPFADGLVAGFVVLHAALVAVSAGGIAGDRELGTLRQLIVAHASRGAVIAARFLALLLLGVLLAVVLAVAAALVAAVFYDFGPVLEDGDELIGLAEIGRELARGFVAALAPLPAAIALGILVGLAARSAPVAVTVALGLTLAYDVAEGLLGRASRFIFASYQPSLAGQWHLKDAARLVRGFSDVLVDERRLGLNYVVSLSEAVLLLAAALVLASRRRM